MASPEQKAELLKMVDGIEAKLGEFNAARFAGENRAKTSKADALRMVINALRDAGVDITNQQAVGDFIGKLRERNPDLADLFEECVSTLLGEDPATPNDMEMDLPVHEATPDETLPQEGPGPLQLGA